MGIFSKKTETPIPLEMPKDTATAEKVGEKITKEADQDIILECRLKPDGGLMWRIPQNIIQAIYLLKILDVAISQILKTSLQPKMSRVVTPGGSKIILPS